MRHVALVADRIGWEERRLIAAAGAHDLRLSWVDDGALCLGAPAAPALGDFDAVMIRSRSYTRGGLIATAAEAARVPVLNTAAAIHACENKLSLRALLRAADLPVPDFRLVLSRADFAAALAELPLPLVLKPVFGGMGKRVTLLRDADTAQSVYDYVEDLGHGFEQAALVEPFLDGGSSVRCFVAGRQLVASASFRSAGGDWRSNAALGNRHRRVAQGPEISKIVDAVVDVLGEGIYGIDLFETPDGFVVNEVNHAPAFRAVADTSELDIPTAVVRYLQEVTS
ncbi:alpha-aminoadipate--LysW ligase LysX [Actinoplanes cyaneus]|uniref:Alpha-aminoadipate--LysW ligase LysX n=1 Tax=Actinoplanes cyaneus TaxID=52696 RepID=A0A919IK82_9ACTN|nr:RimK family alpha-L-glutamate ligase [Actinoplanes cyaneus]MCW2137830.1 [lysine-biosynthesis-protein LysW]---L-2-aminoadipate ligase [Actinoplanes cyaneus]GID64963.1 alpha-aminoadipate--LysW ligase LysX [Actinoplanes cyaneus]